MRPVVWGALLVLGLGVVSCTNVEKTDSGGDGDANAGGDADADGDADGDNGDRDGDDAHAASAAPRALPGGISIGQFSPKFIRTYYI